MKRKQVTTYRLVEPLNDSIWQDAYEYLALNNEGFLNGVENAVALGFSPDEIYRHILREGGTHRSEIAKRCQNAAKYIISQQE